MKSLTVMCLDEENVLWLSFKYIDEEVPLRQDVHIICDRFSRETS